MHGHEPMLTRFVFRHTRRPVVTTRDTTEGGVLQALVIPRVVVEYVLQPHPGIPGCGITPWGG